MRLWTEHCCPGAGLGGPWQASEERQPEPAGCSLTRPGRSGLQRGRSRPPAHPPAAFSWQQIAQPPQLILNLPGFSRAAVTSTAPSPRPLIPACGGQGIAGPRHCLGRRCRGQGGPSRFPGKQNPLTCPEKWGRPLGLEVAGGTPLCRQREGSKGPRWAGEPFPTPRGHPSPAAEPDLCLPGVPAPRGQALESSPPGCPAGPHPWSEVTPCSTWEPPGGNFRVQPRRFPSHQSRGPGLAHAHGALDGEL